MYLAQKKIAGVAHYFIRESYWDGHHYLSRDLIDLGTDPAEHIVYPGGNAFYIDPAIEDHLDELGVSMDADALEDIFWRFLDLRIQRVLEHFRHRGQCSRQTDNPRGASGAAQPPVHIFDKRRLHYLKFGRMEQGYLWLVPQKVFNILRHKSRDEIEQQFMDMELQLAPREYKAYAYVIFNIHRFFTESLATKRPQYLEQSDVDDYFVDEICKLNRDQAFWAGMQAATRLREYLVRYVLMYFDYDFAPRSWMQDYIREFMNSHRAYRPPIKSASLSMAEASAIFDETQEALKKMSRQDLVRLFRRKAQEFHPDKGGDPEKFVRLTRAYHTLLRRKKM